MRILKCCKKCGTMKNIKYKEDVCERCKKLPIYDNKYGRFEKR
jgi:hypothetical protein